LGRILRKREEKLTIYETDKLFRHFANQSLWKPLVEKARVKMASRDLTKIYEVVLLEKKGLNLS